MTDSLPEAPELRARLIHMAEVMDPSMHVTRALLGHILSRFDADGTARFDSEQLIAQAVLSVSALESRIVELEKR